MATRGTAAQAMHEATRVVLSTGVDLFASGMIAVGAATPIVAPLFVALQEAQVIVEGATRNQEELEELTARCAIISVQVLDKFRSTTLSKIDVKPLIECFEKLKVVAKRYHDQGRCVRLVHFRRDGDDIRRLRNRIEAVVLSTGLAGVFQIAEGVANIEDQIKDVREILVRVPIDPQMRRHMDSQVHQQWIDSILILSHKVLMLATGKVLNCVCGEITIYLARHDKER